MPSNIEEGSGRLSNKEFVQFLGYAIVTSYELETQLIIANDLKFISKKQLEETIKSINIIQRKTHGLIKSLRK